VVGGAEAVEAPERARQQAIAQGVAVAPPVVPYDAQVTVGLGLLPGQFMGEQAGDAEQPGLQGGRPDGPGVEAGEEAGAQLGEAAHGPGVVLVAEGGQDAFPESLFPAGLSGGGLEHGGLPFQADLGGLPEKFADPIGGNSRSGAAQCPCWSAGRAGGGSLANHARSSSSGASSTWQSASVGNPAAASGSAVQTTWSRTFW